MLPCFAVAVFVFNATADRLGSRVTALGMGALYACFVCVWAFVAAAIVGFDARTLSFELPEVRGSLAAGVAIGTFVGAGAALVWYFIELLVASWIVKFQRRAVASRRRTSSPAMAEANRLSASAGAYSFVAVGTALGEEVLFRGAVLGQARTEIGAALALLVQAGMFGFVHLSFGIKDVVMKSFFGLLLGWFTVIFVSLLAAVVAHLVFQYLVYQRLRRVALGLTRTQTANQRRELTVDL